MAGDFDGTLLLATVQSGSFGFAGYQLGGSSITPAAPTVTLVSPAEGQIPQNEDVVIDITAPQGLRLVLLSVAFPLEAARPAEVIYSSSRGTGALYGGTTVESIEDGVRVTMRRQGGWPGIALRFDPDVVTTDGAENA